MLKTEALVVETGSDFVVLKLEQKSLCAGCHHKSSCVSLNCSQKIIRIKTLKATRYTSGQKVFVLLDESLGWKALFFAYILPLISLLISLSLSMVLFENEMMAAALGLIVVAFYYVALWFFRKNLERVITIKIDDN